MHFTAVLDACVLYPAPLRDFLMRLAVTDIFAARWTRQIHEEWMRNLLLKRPDLTREQLERTQHLMDRSVRDSLVEGYQPLTAGLSLPDADDHHVLAAAIRCNAQVIVTFNLRDFPVDYTSQFGIEAQHPDVFVEHLLDLNPGLVCEVVKRHRAALKTLQDPSQNTWRHWKTVGW